MNQVIYTKLHLMTTQITYSTHPVFAFHVSYMIHLWQFTDFSVISTDS